MDLADPSIDFVGLARSLGVQAERATTLDAVRSALAKAFSAAGPTLIDIEIDPSFSPI
jgi:thiamine pyrophosphate-dependent acetolactate synthase large subunit-like protein